MGRVAPRRSTATGGGRAPGRPFAALLALAALACAGGSTGGAGAVVHVVRPGENVYRISRYYGVSERDIVRENGIRNVSAIPVGQRLRIPGATRPPAAKSVAVAYVPSAPSPGRALAKRESDLEFAWPLKGWISSKYGWRGRRRHEGIDIPARSGTKIRAAEAGKVIHSGGGLGAYGKVVIVKHAGRYSTVYAHARRIHVRKGQFVERGDVIADVGRTGNASGPHLHFEIRRDRKPEDPLAYLP